MRAAKAHRAAVVFEHGLLMRAHGLTAHEQAARLVVVDDAAHADLSAVAGAVLLECGLLDQGRHAPNDDGLMHAGVCWVFVVQGGHRCSPRPFGPLC